MEIKRPHLCEKRTDENGPSQDSSHRGEVRRVLERELIRLQGGGPLSRATPVDAPVRPEYHPLAERALEKVNRARLQKESAALPNFLESEAPQSEVEPPMLNPSAALTARKSKRPIAPNKGRVERIEISISQGVLPFEDAVLPPNAPQEDVLSSGLAAAPLASRALAGTIDALFVIGCFLLFLGIVFFLPDFSLPTKSSFLGLAVVFFLMSVSYLFLFIQTGAQTLGMDYENLVLVNFDGRPPSPKEIGLRVFGSITSLGCFMLGFIWAFFDPDRLTWHDRISKTLIIQK